MTAAALSDNLPFYDNPDEVKPCEYCSKPLVRRELRQPYSRFRKRKTCSYACRQKLKAGVFIGQQWGYLTVLSEGGSHTAPCGINRNIWVCECVCGKVLFVSTKSLTSGDSQSCGCRGSVVPNQKFGMLKTIKKGEPHIKPNKAKESMWVCECDCGLTVAVRASHLLVGKTTSCGCKTTTRLEDTIERSLNRLKVSYKKEHKPQPLADIGFQYRLDFYLPNHKVNIEADGKAWHRDGNQYKSAEKQRAYDRYRNWWIQETLNCYILRLSEDFLDTIHWRFLDNRLRLFLRSTLEPSPKDRPWKRVTYDFE